MSGVSLLRGVMLDQVEAANYHKKGVASMLIYEIEHPGLGGKEPEEVIGQIELVIHNYQLTVTQKTTLSTKPGSIHWHLKQGKAKGVLEITYWPAKEQILLEIHDNRQADWNIHLIGPIAEELAAFFQGSIKAQKLS